MISIAVAQVQIDLATARVMELKMACNAQPGIGSSLGQVGLLALAIAPCHLVHTADLISLSRKR